MLKSGVEPLPMAVEDTVGAYATIIKGLGESLDREGLRDTPLRAAEAMAELTGGYQQSLEDCVGGAIFHTSNTELVSVMGIDFFSLCEHHLLPFYGRAHVIYQPKGRVLGLSKVARIVDMFARRLQIQEQLVEQIADAVQQVLAPAGVLVAIDAHHLCMSMRGVGKQNAGMCTLSSRGVLHGDTSQRREALQQLSAYGFHSHQ